MSRESFDVKKARRGKFILFKCGRDSTYFDGSVGLQFTWEHLLLLEKDTCDLLRMLLAAISTRIVCMIEELEEEERVDCR